MVIVEAVVVAVRGLWGVCFPLWVCGYLLVHEETPAYTS